MKNALQILSSSDEIAVVRTDKLGDMVLTLPLLRALKIAFPKARISLICSKYVAHLVENLSVIDAVYYVQDYPNGTRDIFKHVKFDAAFFPRPRLRESWDAFRSGIKLRIGSAYRAYSVLYNKRIRDHRKTAQYHEAEYNVRLLTEATGLKADTKLVKPYISPEHDNKAVEIIRRKGLTETGFFIVHPGSGGSAKDWSAENFGQAAQLIFESSGLIPLITGTECESHKCQAVKDICEKAVNMCGEADLQTLIAVIAHSKLLCAGSTGTLHIAASLGVPVAGIYPASPHLSPKRWGPYSASSVTLTPPEGSADIDDVSTVTPEMFAGRVIELISETNRQGERND